MKIILADLNPALVQAWDRAFKGTGVITYLGDIFATEVDGVVSPANSFGFMDGGIDLVYSQRLGWGVQERLRNEIHALPARELLVGQALGVMTAHPRIKWVICAPTMRVPMALEFGTVAPYLATLAALRTAQANGVGLLGFPGMGTGTGRVPPEIAASQMRRAFDHYTERGAQRFASWQAAAAHHAMLMRGDS